MFEPATVKVWRQIRLLFVNKYMQNMSKMCPHKVTNEGVSKSQLGGYMNMIRTFSCNFHTLNKWYTKYYAISIYFDYILDYYKMNNISTEQMKNLGRQMKSV